MRSEWSRTALLWITFIAMCVLFLAVVGGIAAMVGLDTTTAVL